MKYIDRMIIGQARQDLAQKGLEKLIRWIKKMELENEIFDFLMDEEEYKDLNLFV